MTRLFTLILTALLSLGAGAADTAKGVLDKTAKKLSSYPSCQAQFTATMNGRGTSGSITIQGRKFVAVMPETTVWFDGVTMWTLIKSTNEVNVTTPTAAELQRMNPYYFLNLYKSGYDLSLATRGGQHVVSLKATKKQSMKSMEVSVDKSTYLPTSVVMTSQRGSQTTVSISNIKKGKKAPDATFRFNKKDHPKAQVIDLR